MDEIEIVKTGLRAEEVKSSCCASDIWVIDPLGLD